MTRKDVVVGFSLKQRRFFHDVYGNRCAFYSKQNGNWIRCKNTTYLQVHHIVPRGWARVNLNPRFPVNGISNGICLCQSCHEKVHPDVPVARYHYRFGRKDAFMQMMNIRKTLNYEGVPYWETKWDLMFIRLNKRFVGRFTASNKGRKYPTR